MSVVNSWMQTHSGVQFFPFDPQEDQIKIADIAEALSKICRFSGHTREFYSVAQHCIIVSRYVPHEVALEALMHDAAEAYIGDLVAPIKRHCADYCDVEHKIQIKIASKYQLQYNGDWPLPVKRADLAVLGAEARDVMGGQVSAWDLPVPAIPDRILPITHPTIARDAFLRRYKELKRISLYES